MIRIWSSSLFFESFCKCQNYYAMFWNFRGGQILSGCAPASVSTHMRLTTDSKASMYCWGSVIYIIVLFVQGVCHHFSRQQSVQLSYRTYRKSINSWE